jgi:hypothetical protein
MNSEDTIFKVSDSKTAPKTRNEFNSQTFWIDELNYCWKELGKHPDDIKESSLWESAKY